MTSVVRYTLITNPAAAVLSVAKADSGDDFSDQIVKRVFRAEDVGTGAGQTRDGTDPTKGCLVAQFTGSRIIDVTVSVPYRTSAATNANFTDPIYGTAANTTKLGYRVAYDAKSGISSVYVLDRAAAAPGQVAAGDWIYITPYIGNSSSVTALG